MTAPVSVASQFKIAKQAAIGTAATTGFVCGRMKSSTLLPAFEELNPGAEHHCGNSSRPTLRKSTSIRTGYMGVFGGSWFMYPEMIGVVLQGVGFEAATTGLAPEFSHAFTIADRDAALFVTVLNSIGEGAEQFERRLTGGRVTDFGIIANSKGIVCSMQGVGVDVDDAVGTEVSENEPDYLITATDGTLTAEVDSAALVTTVRSMQMSIMNPVDISDARLFSPERNTLPQLGMAVSGVLGGIDVTEDLWNDLYRNGGVSGSPSLVIPQMDLSFTYESVVNIPTGTAPYSFTVAVPKAEVRMTRFGSNGRNLIRCNLAWEMIDDVSEPITITLVNDRATY